MAQRANRGAWGLVVVLTIVVLTLSAVILNQGVRSGAVGMALLPMQQWKFGTEPMVLRFSGNDPPLGVRAFVVGWSLNLGFFKVWRRAKVWRRVDPL